MTTIKNPVIPGMAPDPSIICIDKRYYIATSTFHWTPSIQLFESADLANWHLIGSALNNEEVNLCGTNTPAGIWAPHLSYDSETKRIWLVYSHMVNMAGREFNADTYAIWATDMRGPWSEPIYFTSLGFDPALFHDDDGNHYLTILEWETREGYQAPGHIVIAEIDLSSGELISPWHRVTKGFTTRGCVEAPQIYKHCGTYYLLLASGGTGYGHGVEIGRSSSIFGPYEPHPSGEPILTSSPRHLFSLGDPDAGHFEMVNPDSPMQKAGHGSLVHTHTDEWYMAHLMSRPLEGKLLNPLGRETSLQKMYWTEDNWLRMADGSNLAKMSFMGLAGVPIEKEQLTDLYDSFEKKQYLPQFMTPYRQQNQSWVSTQKRKGYLRIYGGNSLFSQMNPAIMATRATSFIYEVETMLEFQPRHYSQTAGLGLYYDSNNWLYTHLTYLEEKNCPYLTIMQAKLGQRIEYVNTRILVPGGHVILKIKYDHGAAAIFYRLSAQEQWQSLGQELAVEYLSDEGVNGIPGEIGGFTGLFSFIGAVDAFQHQSYADFAYYKVTNL
ncbi:Xylan 1,4-beta-xylosidase [Coriobacterium glomerans PW2]|uniref:Xylan 1,4-beta-xylosidase n=1 Tax=Coriobacterium glomerans (strain ATCC 49209 / DSM 20642 / JCM 10262 / PW2) TaxID=700015 RepID=F2NB45_CORGP|nr:family 43 glycosylhydrolase [Coriobacterium glomerans]AEB07796.1 Xylan 1,4-beta-xylosidase [Coriobacterium glomerans PW2]